MAGDAESGTAAPREDQLIISQDRTVAIVAVRGADSVATLTIAGRSVLEGTVRALCAVPEIGSIVLALDGVGEAECLAAIEKLGDVRVSASASSGSRWLAISSALAVAGEGNSVLIQNADRPLFSPMGVGQLLAALRQAPSVVTAVPVHSSIKRVVDGRVVATVPRATLHAVQSPWLFERRVLEDALRLAIARGWSPADELELARRANIPVRLVEGDMYNVPIASHADARFADMAVERRLVWVPGAAAFPA